MEIKGFKKGILPIAVFSVLLFIFFWVLNSFTPLLVDDYHYSFLRDDIRITSFSQIIERLWEHYLYPGGRIVAHFIAMVFLWIGKPVFNVFNALVFCLLQYLIFMHAEVRKPGQKHDIFAFLFAFAASWVSFPMFYQTVVWLCGSANHLWTTMLILLFLIPYRGFVEDKPIIKDNASRGILWFFVGIIAGWTNENTAAVSLLGVFLVFLYEFFIKKTRQFPRWFFPGAVGHLIGYGLLILAPGNYARASAHFDKPPLLKGFGEAKHFVREFLLRSFGYYDRAIAIVWIMIAALLIYLLLRKKLLERQTIFAFAYIGLGLISKLIMIAAPYFPERTEFGGAVLIVIGGTILFQSVFSDLRQIKAVRLGILALFIPVVISGVIVATQYHQRYVEFNERLAKVEEYKRQGILDVVLEPLTEIKSRYIFADTLAEDPEDFRNREFIRYFGLNSARLEARK